MTLKLEKKQIIAFQNSGIIKIKNFFKKDFEPYEIGFVSKNKKKVILSNYLKW